MSDTDDEPKSLIADSEGPSEKSTMEKKDTSVESSESKSKPSKRPNDENISGGPINLKKKVIVLAELFL